MRWLRGMDRILEVDASTSTTRHQEVSLTTRCSEQQLIQNSISNELRGRVMALYSLMMRGGTAMGSMCMGMMGEWLGISWPVFIGGVALLLLCGWIFSIRGFLEKSLERNSDP